VESLFAAIPTDTRVVIASRYRESPVYEIPLRENPLKMLIPKIKASVRQQLSLF